VRAIYKKTIEIYKDRYGFEPYTEWLSSFKKDYKTLARIEQRIGRMEHGNLGDYKALKEGIFELRLDFGPGYRIYFGQENQRIVMLLCGGNKNTQKNDIVLAKTFWQDYQEIRNEKI